MNIIFNRNLIVTHQAGHESYDQNLIFTPAKYFCSSDSFGTNLFLAVNVLNSFDHDFDLKFDSTPKSTVKYGCSSSSTKCYTAYEFNEN